MDQISLISDSFVTESIETEMVSVWEHHSYKCVYLMYSDHHIAYEKGVLMSFEDSLSYLVASKKEHIGLNFPQTEAHFDHMAKVMDVCKHKNVEILLEHGELNGLTEPFLKMGIQKCIGMEKNTIIVRYDRHNFFEQVDGRHSDLLRIENKAAKFACVVGFHDNPVFPHLVNSLKLLKNSDRLIHVYLHDDFKTLFESMKWTFGKKMVNWMNKDTKTEYMMVEDKWNPMDNNEYKIMHMEYEGERESDCESEMSDELSCHDESTDEFSSDENESLGAENDTEHLLVSIVEGTLRVAEVPLPDSNEMAVVLFYSWETEIPHEFKEMSYDAVLDYISKSKNKTIAIEEPEVPLHFDHIDEIMAIRGDKEVFIRLCNPDETGVSGYLRQYVMEKCVEKQEKNIFLSFLRAKDQRVDGIVDSIYIESEVNNVSCQINQHQNSLFPQFVECIKDVKNQNCVVDIEMKTHFKMLIKAMKWRDESNRIDWLMKNTKVHAIMWEPDNKADDNNKYHFHHKDYDEDAECDCETCTYEPDSSEYESDEYSSDGEVNAAADNLDKICLKDCQSSPRKRKIVSEYMENVPPAKIASMYFNEEHLLVSIVEGTLRVAEVPLPDSNEMAVVLFYSWETEIPHEFKEMSYDAVLDYISKSKNKTIAIEEPEVPLHFDHIDEIMAIRGDKEVFIRLCNPDETGVSGYLRQYVMEKCVEKQEKNIFLSFLRAKDQRVDGIVDSIYIESEVNNVSCQINQHQNSLFPQFVECIKDVKNQNCVVDIEMKTHFKMLIKAMKWRDESNRIDWLMKNTKVHAIMWEPDNKADDNNKYHFHHKDYDEDAECDCETCTYEPDSSEYESDEYSSDGEVNAAADNLDKICLKDCQSSPRKRKIVSEYMENVPPAKIASMYFNEVTASGVSRTAISFEALQPTPDIFGRIPSQIKFPGRLAFYDHDTNTMWDGEQGWTWRHEAASTQIEEENMTEA